MMNKKDIKEQVNKKQESLIKKMIEAGVHFGHNKSRKNPRMNSYICTTRNNISIIDPAFSVEKLEEALKFIKELVKSGGIILFVGTQPQAKKITQEAAKECGMPYVTERWLGGTLTNFKTIYKRVEHLKDLEQKEKSEELKKYTKKEQMLFNNEINKLNRNLGGIKELNKLPKAVLVLSIRNNSTAVKEAKIKEIPVIGLADTDSDPTIVDYFIPSNDDAVSALKFMLDKIKDIIIKNLPTGRQVQPTKTKKNDKSRSSKTT